MPRRSEEIQGAGAFVQWELPPLKVVAAASAAQEMAIMDEEPVEEEPLDEEPLGENLANLWKHMQLAHSFIDDDESI